jgi:lipopolysaccharide/colanic/teichoic acid biosynthesis glycosyltransferase
LRKTSPRNDRSARQSASANGVRPSSPRTINRETPAAEFSTFAGTAEPAARFPGWKRILDLSFVLITLPVWLPVMLLVMALIRFSSAGPIFYRQERVGYHRRRFMIFKFRTMQVNAETRTHEDYFASLMRSEAPMTKLDAAGDSRLIPWARFLRASGLDELPQIFNVLRGEMSLVGPRPCLPSEFNRYEKWQQNRVNAPPGLTGYWQVNGKNKTTFNQMIFMDLFYIDKMSIWFDLGIIVKTVPVLVFETIAALKRYRSRTISRLAASAPQSMAAIPSRSGAHQPSRNGSQQ